MLGGPAAGADPSRSLLAGRANGAATGRLSACAGRARRPERHTGAAVNAVITETVYPAQAVPRQGVESGAWWRAPRAAAVVDDVTGSGRVAFGALVAFTAILFLSPQIWFPILGSLRIAFLAAGLSIA